MGEVAEMMLTGVLCEGCGGYLEGKAEGYPRYCCTQCAKDRDADLSQVVTRTKDLKLSEKKPKRQCGICKAWIKEVGMKDHVRDKHEVKEQQS